ncbi:MAG: hypothetical protein K0U72_14275 [Gammaproteobacteria bacterium]|nr:hypothetical protein [Gammaproteobacteria bacterium]
MSKGLLSVLAVICLCSTASHAEDQNSDPFRGKLFAPNVIIEHKEELNLTKQQFTKVRAAVVEVQSGVAEYEWDMQAAYQELMRELDEAPIDEAAVIEHASKALLAENEVKKMQVSMLVRLRNLLNDEQIRYLESVTTR